MTTKNQNYIELPVQADVGTPEAGYISLGFYSAERMRMETRFISIQKPSRMRLA
jgi:hypothetical protein